MRGTESSELILLRDFYHKWVIYHECMNKNIDRRSLAGQDLIDAHKAIETYNDIPLVVTANG